MVRIIALAAALLLATGAGAGAQSTLTADAIGRYVYDASGAPIGSVRDINGDQAILLLGNYTWPGSRLVRIPQSDLAQTAGRVTLRTGSAVALRALPDYLGG